GRRVSSLCLRSCAFRQPFPSTLRMAIYEDILYYFSPSSTGLASPLHRANPISGDASHMQDRIFDLRNFRDYYGGSKTMVLNKLAAVILACLALGACSYGPPTPGELKDFDAVCDKANSGKRIAVVGYLRFPDKITGNQSGVLRLYKEP